jgi:hypothetical protein
MARGKKRFGYTAFAPEDKEDAKRGHPAVHLADYAASRGLSFYDQAVLGAFASLLPAFPEYTFNVMRGVLPGGRYGALQHQLEEIEVDQEGIRGNGSFYGSKYTYKNPGGLLNLISPVDIISEKAPTEAFANNAAWAPTTKVTIRVPEAALLPQLLVRRADRFTLWGNPKLDPYGLPGFKIGQDDLPDDLLTAVFSGPVGQVLASLPYPYVEMRLRHGAVALQRNGYASTEAELDQLAQAGCAIAEGLRAVAAPLLQPQPFTAELPPPTSAHSPLAPWFFRPDESWADGLQRAAAERGMVQEDPVAYHQAFPTVPVPGTALGVFRGTIPGSNRFGRLAFHYQGGTTTGTVRGAVLLQAPADPPAFQPGGTPIEQTDMYVEVVDGVAAFWNKKRTFGGLSSADLAAAALQTAALVGL